MLFSRRWELAFLVLLITLIGFSIYWPAQDAPFVLDSFHHISQNQKLHDVASGNWFYGMRVLANLSLAIDYAIYGESPAGFLFTNILIHIASSLVLFYLIKASMALRPSLAKLSNRSESQRARKKNRRKDVPKQTVDVMPWLATLIWFAHPLQTQSVIYHVQRMESLMGLFLLLALLCLNRFISSSNLTWLGIGGLAAVCSMASKEVGFVTPALMLMYYYVFQHEEALQTQKKLLGVLLLLFVVAGSLGAWKLWTSNAMGELGFDSRVQKSIYYLATQSQVVLFYLQLVIFPFGQNLDHGFTYIESFVSAVIPTLLLSVALIYGVYLLVKKASWAF